MSADRSDAAATPALTSQAELDSQLSALVALCSGQPVHLPQIDLIEVANSHWSELDATQDRADIGFPLLALHWYVDHVGILRSTKGDRAVGIATELRRYVLPFLLELAMTSGGLPAAEFRVLHVKHLQKILAGVDALPAATVAGDALKRFGVTCVWLTLSEAAEVSTVSLRQLQAAAVNGQLPRAVQQHDGQWLVAALGLREAGWLREPKEPHGLAKGTASNTLRVLCTIAEYASALGADLRGNFRSKALTGLTPLLANRLGQGRDRDAMSWLPRSREQDAAAHFVAAAD